MDARTTFSVGQIRSYLCPGPPGSMTEILVRKGPLRPDIIFFSSCENLIEIFGLVFRDKNFEFGKAAV